MSGAEDNCYGSRMFHPMSALTVVSDSLPDSIVDGIIAPLVSLIAFVIIFLL